MFQVSVIHALVCIGGANGCIIHALVCFQTVLICLETSLFPWSGVHDTRTPRQKFSGQIRTERFIDLACGAAVWLA